MNLNSSLLAQAASVGLDLGAKDPVAAIPAIRTAQASDWFVNNEFDPVAITLRAICAEAGLDVAKVAQTMTADSASALAAVAVP